MSAEHRQNPYNQSKHVLMNNWIYMEYIPVFPHYLTIPMSKSTMTHATSGQDYLFFPNLTVRTRSLVN
jgi:hypothetical protein